MAPRRAAEREGLVAVVTPAVQGLWATVRCAERAQGRGRKRATIRTWDAVLTARYENGHVGFWIMDGAQSVEDLVAAIQRIHAEAVIKVKPPRPA